MKTAIFIFWFVAATLTATAVEKDAPKQPAKDLVFRQPFTLRLHIDKENYYEQEIGKIPYVADSVVYLFRGDEFGVTLQVQDNKITGVKYEPEIKKAEVTFKFSQEKLDEKTVVMMLVIRNTTKHPLEMEALMTVPGKEGFLDTTILPIPPGLTNYESWPHAIIQLALRNFKIGKKPAE